MGNVQNSAVTAALTLLQQNITNIAVTVTNNAAANLKTNQNLNVTFNNTTGCQNYVGQFANVNLNLSSIFAPNTSTSMSSVISSAVAQTAASLQSSVQGFLATALGVQNTSSAVSTAITNILTSNIAQSMYNTCIANATVDQTGNITFSNIDCTKAGNNIVNQSAQLTVLLNCVNNAVSTLLTNALSSATATQAAATTQNSNQAGASQLLSALELPLIIIGGLIVLALLYYFLRKRGGSNSTTSKSNAK